MKTQSKNYCSFGKNVCPTPAPEVAWTYILCSRSGPSGSRMCRPAADWFVKIRKTKWWDTNGGIPTSQKKHNTRSQNLKSKHGIHQNDTQKHFFLCNYGSPFSMKTMVFGARFRPVVFWLVCFCVFDYLVNSLLEFWFCSLRIYFFACPTTGLISNATHGFWSMFSTRSVLVGSLLVFDDLVNSLLGFYFVLLRVYCFSCPTTGLHFQWAPLFLKHVFDP